MNIHFEVFLAAGYAIFLLGVAIGLDLLARHSHARSERYRTAGFAYHPTHDAWICPEDQILMRSEADHERRLIRYRGRPQICNHCPAKTECTDSDDGLEVVRAMDPWPHSEAGRFHRGISLVMVLLAALVLSVEAFRNHAPLELAVLGAMLVVVAVACWHLHSAFRAARPTSQMPAAVRRSPSLKRLSVRATDKARRRVVERGRGSSLRNEYLFKGDQCLLKV